MDQQRLERALRQGPQFATRYVPSSLALDGQPAVRGAAGVRRLVLVIAATALLLVGLLAGLVAGGLLQRADRLASNGWIAFAGDDGIYVVREGEDARRIIGSAADRREQACPAFSPDGSRLAHGEADGTYDSGYRAAALVISDLDANGNVSESLRIDVGGAFPPPCAAWSADGRRVAFPVPLTSTINPDRPAAGSEVWVVTVADGNVVVLPDLLATDLEWSPQGPELAIASGQTGVRRGQRLRDGSIRLYDADSGEMRTLVGPSGVVWLTWSPDGSRIAYQRGRSDGGVPDQEILVVRLDGSGETVIASRFGALYGVGPEWSPSGDHIVYQRMKSSGTEAHWVVLVTPDGMSEVVLPDLQTLEDGRLTSWRPDSVTWSPDGNELLYTAWISGKPGRALISRRLAEDSDPVVLHHGVSAGGENRSWGRLPSE